MTSRRPRRDARSLLGLPTVLIATTIAGSVLVFTTGNAAPNGSPQKVATADSPIGIVRHPITKAVFVIEQSGRLRSVQLKTGKVVKAGDVALNLSKRVSTGNEQGFLGAAFSPDGTWLYTNHTNRDGDTEITAWVWSGTKAVASSEKRLLSVDQPYSNHNGGGLQVTTDGVLWIGLGDGGSAGDPEGNAQSLDSLLGKILRIKPTPNGSKPYTIPDGNVAAERGRPEIWAYGIRNPWGFAIDEARKLVWIADVGQNTYEEVNRVALDQSEPNFGWNAREGTHAYKGGTSNDSMIEPVHDYKHGDGAMEGCSVTGGVIRKDGSFIFSDYCIGTLRSIGAADTKAKRIGSATLDAVSGFGYDADGNVLVTSREGDILRLP